MDNKVIGTIAAIGVIGYLYSQDVFKAEAPPPEEPPEGEDTGGQYDTSGDDEGGTHSTDWCAVKANSPTHIKKLEGEIADERLRLKKELEATITKAKKDSQELSAKFEKEAATGLKEVQDRYEESKKKCSAKEEVQKKLQDEDVGEGFWEKLLAFLNA